MKILSASLVVCLALAGLCPASGAVIYESATMGPTRQSSGAGLGETQFLGARFHVASPVRVTSVGGHMWNMDKTPLFGAIVSLSESSAFPSGAPFDSTVVASKAFDPGNVDSDYLTQLDADLNVGWYALIFGAGQFGSPSNTVGIMSYYNLNSTSASYFFWNGRKWQDGGFSNVRFVVEGGPSESQVPESATFLMLGGGLLGLAFLRRRQ